MQLRGTEDIKLDSTATKTRD